MREDVAAIIGDDCSEHDKLPNLVAALPDESALWELMSQYNWDDGFIIPLAVSSHPRCDRALALRMFWELDDSAQLHYGLEEVADHEMYAKDLCRSHETRSTRVRGRVFAT
ncbi:hypothetical protein CDES_00115 [Corynebacterium deserti GIMN1.010]|uniref:DUF4274 domain-containing protein n=1 Tax=Corynebacterium deserti GIMN1.010 TaxID=931089 RepID=A0A0M5IID4_9CORY|nr:DUF4274 domain-containing protein [Corynebacterium deserti]ALC04511.1 hypothetical protein CDES_00115 [Corynebacterium deserti GIMN1.010]